MKKMLILAAGAMLFASAVQAQTGNSSDATVSATLSGIFIPRALGNWGVKYNDATITVKASQPFALIRPVSIPSRDAILTSGGYLSRDQASTLASALATLRSRTTAGAAASAFNAAVALVKTMTPNQQEEFFRGNGGYQVLAVLIAAAQALFRLGA